MNKLYIYLATIAVLVILLGVVSNRAINSSRQAEYWHGRYDQSVSAQKRNDSIAGVYQVSLITLADSANARGIRKETSSNITATKINNKSTTKK